MRAVQSERQRDASAQDGRRRAMHDAILSERYVEPESAAERVNSRRTGSIEKKKILGGPSDLSFFLFFFYYYF